MDTPDDAAASDRIVPGAPARLTLRTVFWIFVKAGLAFGGGLSILAAGTVVALLGLTLPAFTTTVALTAGYTALKDTRLVALLPVTVLPAALALVVAAAVHLARTTAMRLPDLAIAAVTLAASAVFHANPAVLLLLAGVAGAIFLRPRAGAEA